MMYFSNIYSILWRNFNENKFFINNKFNDKYKKRKLNLRIRKISILNAQDNLILRNNTNLAIQKCMAIVIFIRIFLSQDFSNFFFFKEY